MGTRPRGVASRRQTNPWRKCRGRSKTARPSLSQRRTPRQNGRPARAEILLDSHCRAGRTSKERRPPHADAGSWRHCRDTPKADRLRIPSTSGNALGSPARLRQGKQRDPPPTWFQPLFQNRRQDGQRGCGRHRSEKFSSLSFHRASSYPASSLPGVRVFDCEPCFPNLRWVCRSNTRELRSHVIDNVEVAVGTIVVTQPKIGANCLGV